MRMPTALTTLLAVLCGAVVGAGDYSANSSRWRHHPFQHHPHRTFMEEDLEPTAAWKRSHWRESQQLLRNNLTDDGYAECCPSVLEMVANKGGKTLGGRFVELYANPDDDIHQHLYELSCAPGVVGKPCRFVDARLYNYSRCIQKYSFSYALVRYTAATESPEHRYRRGGNFEVPGTGGWSMDYVSVRSGCECQITPPKWIDKSEKPEKKGRKRPERHKQKKKVRRLEKEDET